MKNKDIEEKVMFCANCGTKLEDGARFCQECGVSVGDPTKSEATGQHTVLLRARVTFVFHGYGDLILTDQYIAWNKSGTTFLAFGILGTLTDDHMSLELSEIATVDTYTYIGSGGIRIMDKSGREFKFSFKKKKEFLAFYDCLKVYGQ